MNDVTHQCCNEIIFTKFESFLRSEILYSWFYTEIEKNTYKLQIFVNFWVRCKPICAHYSQSSFANIEAKIFAKPFSLAKIVVYRLSPFKWIYQNMVIKCRLWRERVPDAADTPIFTGFFKVHIDKSVFREQKQKARS